MLISNINFATSQHAYAPVQNKQSYQQQITFGSCGGFLKELYLWDKIKIIFGLYGELISKSDVTTEHVIARSKGGTSEVGNTALTSKAMNQKRGNDNIGKHLTDEHLEQYANQFRGIYLPEEKFNGDEYIYDLYNNVNKAKEL